MGPQGYWEDLPQYTGQARSGNIAADRFGLWVREQGHIWRPEHQENDFGVDGEAELAGHVVSGLLVKAQVKGIKSAAFNSDGRLKVPVKHRTLNYWTILRLPVVAILVDHATKRMYWEAPPPAFASGTEALSFDERREITGDPAGFFDALRTLAQHPPAVEELDRIPFFFEWLAGDTLQQLGDFDAGTRVGVVVDGTLGLFYEHVVRLSGLLHGTTQALIPHAQWVRRDELATFYRGWDDTGGISDLVASEMVQYLRGTYRTLLAELRQLAEAASDGMASLWNYHPSLAFWITSTDLEVELPPWGRADPVLDPRPLSGGDGSTAQARIDAMLEAAGIARLPLMKVIADVTARERRP
jgi:hypothetical protein